MSNLSVACQSLLYIICWTIGELSLNWPRSQQGRLLIGLISIVSRAPQLGFQGEEPPSSGAPPARGDYRYILLGVRDYMITGWARYE